jgi:hypothetical protein
MSLFMHANLLPGSIDFDECGFLPAFYLLSMGVDQPELLKLLIAKFPVRSPLKSAMTVRWNCVFDKPAGRRLHLVQIRADEVKRSRIGVVIKKGSSLLHVACQFKLWKSAAFLWAQSTMSADSDGFTPFHWVCRHGILEDVRHLVFLFKRENSAAFKLQTRPTLVEALLDNLHSEKQLQLLSALIEWADAKKLPYLSDESARAVASVLVATKQMAPSFLNLLTHRIDRSLLLLECMTHLGSPGLLECIKLLIRSENSQRVHSASGFLDIDHKHGPTACSEFWQVVDFVQKEQQQREILGVFQDNDLMVSAALLSLCKRLPPRTVEGAAASHYDCIRTLLHSSRAPWLLADADGHGVLSRLAAHDNSSFLKQVAEILKERAPPGVAVRISHALRVAATDENLAVIISVFPYSVRLQNNRGLLETLLSRVGKHTSLVPARAELLLAAGADPFDAKSATVSPAFLLALCGRCDLLDKAITCRRNWLLPSLPPQLPQTLASIVLEYLGLGLFTKEHAVEPTTLRATSIASQIFADDGRTQTTAASAIPAAASIPFADAASAAPASSSKAAFAKLPASAPEEAVDSLARPSLAGK